MTRYFLIILFLFSMISVNAQKVVSIGVFTGISMPFTFDQGVNSDPRYSNRNDVKFCPFGINYGVDFEGFGFNFSPGLITTGQNFSVVNIYGQYEGVRKIKMQYLNIPVGLKAHLIDLRVLKISFIASTGFAYLLNAEETISHQATKLKFPDQTKPYLPPNYTSENDGVVVPEVNRYKMLSKSDFNNYQINFAVGFRSDWNVTDEWRLSFDIRLNYGLLEPRTDAYLKKLSDYTTLYDTPGKRRDAFGNLNVCVSRYMNFSKKKVGKRIKVKTFN